MPARENWDENNAAVFSTDFDGSVGGGATPRARGCCCFVRRCYDTARSHLNDIVQMLAAVATRWAAHRVHTARIAANLARRAASTCVTARPCQGTTGWHARSRRVARHAQCGDHALLVTVGRRWSSGASRGDTPDAQAPQPYLRALRDGTPTPFAALVGLLDVLQVTYGGVVVDVVRVSDVAAAVGASAVVAAVATQSSGHQVSV